MSLKEASSSPDLIVTSDLNAEEVSERALARAEAAGEVIHIDIAPSPVRTRDGHHEREEGEEEEEEEELFEIEGVEAVIKAVVAKAASSRTLTDEEDVASGR